MKNTNARIYKTFDLAGITITTHLDSTMFTTRKIGGEAQYLNQAIVIDPTAHPIESVTQTYYHEKIHYILFIMNRHDLRTDEAFVDMFAHLLYQSDKSAGESYTEDELLKGI
jgi:hypothetical protein